MKLPVRFLLSFGCFFSGMVFAATNADQSMSGVTAQSVEAQKDQEAEDPAEKKYKQEMMQLSQQITQKISQIQAKQKEMNDEVYPAYKAEHKAALKNLESQLKNLEMKRSQLESEKTARDMAKSLKGS